MDFFDQHLDLFDQTLDLFDQDVDFVYHKLDVVDIFNPDATLNHQGLHYQGKDRFEVRKAVVKELEAAGALVKITPHVHKVGTSERTKAVIEPRLSDQWFLKMADLAKPAIDAVEEDDVQLVPKKFINTYRHWMNNIRDWNISRQLWWGHQIPAYYYGPNSEHVVVADTKSAALEKAKVDSGNAALTLDDLHQDPDVLDTWFSSWLWPISVFNGVLEPDNKEISYYYPTQDLVTGPDILFFWVARMMMFGMEFLNKEPFKDIYVHALVRDEKGQKMSKSKGNVIDPLDLIEKYSADALRFTLLSMASPGTDVKLSEDRVKGYRNFLNKLWNANNFLNTNECDFKNTDQISELKVNINKWIYSELAETTNKIVKNLEDYRFDEAAKNAYQFTWHSYCDWYLELSKTILFSDDEDAKEEVKKVSAYVFKQILVLLHPFIPFVTEEIWLKNKLFRIIQPYLLSRSCLKFKLVDAKRK